MARHIRDDFDEEPAPLKEEPEKDLFLDTTKRERIAEAARLLTGVLEEDPGDPEIDDEPEAPEGPGALSDDDYFKLITGVRGVTKEEESHGND